MADGEWHQVSQGEWLSKIAAQYKLSSWETIWNHPNNADLRSRRSPNILYPGDSIFIPAPQPKNASCATDQTHQFQLKKLWETFQLQILDGFKRPIANQKYVLTIGSQIFRGVTDANGHFEQKKILSNPDGPVTLHLPKLGLMLPIALGYLNPGCKQTDAESTDYDNGLSGIQMRLANLGYAPGNTDGVMDDDTVAALTEFQIFEMNRNSKDATGKLDDDTRNALFTQHKS